MCHRMGCSDQIIRNSSCLDQKWRLGNPKAVCFPEAPGNLDRALAWGGEEERGKYRTRELA